MVQASVRAVLLRHPYLVNVVPYVPNQCSAQQVSPLCCAVLWTAPCEHEHDLARIIGRQALFQRAALRGHFATQTYRASCEHGSPAPKELCCTGAPYLQSGNTSMLQGTPPGPLTSPIHCLQAAQGKVGTQPLLLCELLTRLLLDAVLLLRRLQKLSSWTSRRAASPWAE